MNRHTFPEAVNCYLHIKRVSLVIFVVSLALAAVPSIIIAGTTPDIQPVTNEMLLSSQDDPESWLMYGRDYRSWRYSQLTQVNTENVKKLVPKWAFQIGTPF